MKNVKCKTRAQNTNCKMKNANLNAKSEMRNQKCEKGFSMIEVIITISLFLLLAGVGVGAYFQYYQASFINADVDNALTLIKFTRYKALKNATSDNYGIHINMATNSLIGFRDTYNPMDNHNEVLKLEQLRILDLSLNPDLGNTDEILFEKQTGKTENTGSFTIGNDNFTYTFNINPQGVVN